MASFNIKPNLLIPKSLLKLFVLMTPLIILLNAQEADQNSSPTDETPICGGFLEFDSSVSKEIRKKIDYSSIIVQSFTMDMILKEQTNLAASGYYFLPVYENESFMLKITGPYGMNFEPEQFVFTVSEDKSVSTFCKNDINFKFRGFIVEGQVSTFGTNEGPEGINLVLYNEENVKIHTTKTMDKGLFKFKPVNPGNYILKPHEDIHMFDKEHNELKFTVNIDSSNFLERALIIRGFRVFGSILADQEPLEGVWAYIYAFNATLTKNYNCDYVGNNDNTNTVNTNFNYPFTYKGKEMQPFCLSQTDSNGQFSFKNIPYGKFLVKPVYKNEYISYDLEPEFSVFDVEHKDFKLYNPFIASHFSIYGKVVNSKSNGIPNVTIKIDGQVKAITDSNGIYRFENLTPGNYDLEAQADDMFFEPLTNIKITAHLKHLPDLIVTDYKLCGKIVIEATDYFPTSKRTVVLLDTSESDKSSKKERRTITDQKGRYCFEVKPSQYQIYPVLTHDEKEADLHLQPEHYDLEIIDRPLKDVNFYQSKVLVRGSVECIEECDPNVKIRLVSLKTDRSLTTQIDQNKQFEFKDILSGQYKLIIIKPEWCWDLEEILIKVQNSDIKNIKFKQSGYSLFYSSQHNINVEWENSVKNITERATLERSKSKICLPTQGVYKVTPMSCHKFKEQFFMYETDKSPRLELTPIEYLTRGLIQMDQDLYNSSLKKNITDMRVLVNIDEKTDSNNNSITPYKSLTLDLKEKVTSFEFYTKPHTDLILTPTISKELITKNKYKNIIFSPKEKILKVEQSCIENPSELIFKMKSGLIIEGVVTPLMEDVTIMAINKDSKETVSSTVTNNEGKYKIGPLYKEFNYDIKASKEGYKIVANVNNPYNFNAEKLSFLRVKIKDTNGKPLNSVFLSLSSADRGFKINNNTNSEGYFDFIELYSGDYYIKPLFKEYKFEPAQKLVSILGGQHYVENLVAHRIAFSIYGKINNLNKERVEGLYIQAYDEKTKQLQETAIDKNGEYRLKGMNPGSRYIIRVKISPNSSIEKALPNNIPIMLGKEDVTGVDFVVLQRPKQIDIRGYLNYSEETDNCPFSKVQNTYVELSIADYDDEDAPIKTKYINNACQFVYRNLEKKRYQVKVFEKQGKMNQYPKLLLEQIIDLSDEREISGGVKILKLDIETVKKNATDNLNYTVYSPIFLFLMVFSILKYEYTVWVFDNFVSKPLGMFGGVFGRKKGEEKEVRREQSHKKGKKHH